MDASGDGQMDRVEAARERRRRINEAFRSGDLRSCLTEISAGLREDPDDATLSKALGPVRTRYLSEVVEPAVNERRWEEGQQALADLRASGTLPLDVQERVGQLERRIEELRRPPEEALDVREKTLRKAEEAWASGRKREARELLRTLNGLPMDDHDLALRRDGLARLVEEETARPTREGAHPRRSGRWIAIFIGMGVIAVAAVLLRGMVGPKKVDQPVSEIPPPVVTEIPASGWLAIHATPPDAEIHDSTGLVLGTASRTLSLPEGSHRLLVMASGYRETTLVVPVAQAETVSVTVALASVVPTQGILSLRSEPAGAKVLNKGEIQLGTTPLEVPLEMGQQRILVTADGRVSEWISVRIRAGEVTDTSITLWPRYPFGRLQINATPWAFVFINGDSLGPTPLTTGDLATGVEHECVFRRPDGSVIRQRVRLDPKRATPTPLTVGAAMPAVLAVAARDSVTGRPTWASVWVGSRLLGEAPGEFEVSPGEITVRVEREGYEVVTRTVELAEGKRTTVSVALMPVR
jgi:hypothetical protein